MAATGTQFDPLVFVEDAVRERDGILEAIAHGEPVAGAYRDHLRKYPFLSRDIEQDGLDRRTFWNWCVRAVAQISEGADLGSVDDARKMRECAAKLRIDLIDSGDSLAIVAREYAKRTAKTIRVDARLACNPEWFACWLVEVHDTSEDCGLFEPVERLQDADGEPLLFLTEMGRQRLESLEILADESFFAACQAGDGAAADADLFEKIASCCRYLRIGSEDFVQIGVSLAAIYAEIETSCEMATEVQAEAKAVTEAADAINPTTEIAPLQHNPPAVPPTTRSRKQAKLDWIFRAMTKIHLHPHLTNAAVAIAVGVSPSQLSRSPEYQRAAKMARNPGSPRRGIRNKDGDIEATPDNCDGR